MPDGANQIGLGVQWAERGLVEERVGSQLRLLPARQAIEDVACRVRLPEQARVEFERIAQGAQDFLCGRGELLTGGDDATDLVLRLHAAFVQLGRCDVVADKHAALDHGIHAARAQWPPGDVDPQSRRRQLMLHEQLQVVERFAAHAACQREFLQTRRAIRMKEDEVALDQLRAEDMVRHRIGQHDPPLPVGNNNGVAHVVEDRLQELTLLAQRLLGLLAIGDVAHDRQHRRFAVEMNGRRVDIDIDTSPVLGAVNPFNANATGGKLRSAVDSGTRRRTPARRYRACSA